MNRRDFLVAGAASVAPIVVGAPMPAMAAPSYPDLDDTLAEIRAILEQIRDRAPSRGVL
jgi:hypothetical protein